MPVRRLLVVAAVALVCAAVAVAARDPRFVPGPDLRAFDGVEFITTCDFSHRASDDPIVFPRQPDFSHDHTFFGNVDTDAFSTPASLRREGATSCERNEDTAAYWAPTLLVDDKAVIPVDAKIYYRRRTIQRLRAFPAGLEMVAGDSHARAQQPTSVVSFSCGDGALEGVAHVAAVPTCPTATGAKSLNLNVRFPDCWDGKRLDSPDHQSHMAYSARGACPASHPVAVPSIEIAIQYPVAGGPGVELSSQGTLTGHADFVNGWQQPALQRLVDYCLNALRACDRAP